MRLRRLVAFQSVRAQPPTKTPPSSQTPFPPPPGGDVSGDLGDATQQSANPAYLPPKESLGVPVGAIPGTGNNQLNAAVASQAQVTGSILRENAAAVPGQAQDMAGVSRVSNLLNSLLGRTPSGPAPTGIADGPGAGSAVAANANMGSIPYLRGEGDESSAGNRGKIAPGPNVPFLGGLPMPLEDPKTALQNLTSVITVSPGDGKALSQRARVYNSLKKYKEAEADARKALLINPNDAVAWSQLAWSLLKQRRYQEALASVERAILANPRKASNYALRAYLRYVLGDVAGAMKDMEMAASLDPAYRPQLEAFRNGGKLYDPDEDTDASIMLTHTMRRAPLALPFALLLAFGLAAWFARRAYGGRKNAKAAGFGAPAALSLAASKILYDADAWQGTPYGTGPGQSDCASFTRAVYGDNGMQIPSTVLDQFAFFSSGAGGCRFIPDAASLQPGDAVFFGNGRAAEHVGIVTGNNDGIVKFLDANTRDRAITPSTFSIKDRSYDSYVFMGGGRIPALIARA